MSNWKEGDPVEYDAQTTWLQHERARSLPGNIPAKTMRAMMAGMADPHIREQMAKDQMPNSDLIHKWTRLQKMEKVEFVMSVERVDEVNSLLSVEEDDDVCECLIARRRELRG